MNSEEVEVTIEIQCVQLPGTRWGDRGPLFLGIQQGEEVVETASAGLQRIVFRPVLRVREETNGSANFLGPFAKGPRTERFIYLVCAALGDSPGMLGRVKVHLNHLKWADVEQAVGRKKPIKVTIPLTSSKGTPVCASVRNDAAKWEL